MRDHLAIDANTFFGTVPGQRTDYGRDTLLELMEHILRLDAAARHQGIENIEGMGLAHGVLTPSWSE